MKIKVNEALINRLFMKLNPSFFSLSKDEQLNFMVSFRDDEEKEEIMEKFIMKDVLGKKEDITWDDLSSEEKGVYNAYSTWLSGVGENRLKFSEFLPEGKTLLDYKTVYDYDLMDYEFQEEFRKKNAKVDYEIKPYNLYLSGIWCRFFDENKVFHYSTIESISKHVYWSIESAIHEEIEKLIPHEYVSGKDDGKEENGGYILDLKLSANGKEREYEELRDRAYKYQKEVYNSLEVELHGTDKDAPILYIKRYISDYDKDSHFDIIVKNVAAAKHLELNNLLSKAYEIEGDYKEVEDIKEKYVKKAKEFVQKEYKDIEENFDPTIIKFKKKNKIIISKDFNGS